MQEYFFANYRLLIDEKLAERKDMKYLEGFRESMPFAHTFTVRLGDEAELNQRYEDAMQTPVVCDTGQFLLHDARNGWSITMPAFDHVPKTLVLSSRDYSDITVYLDDTKIFSNLANRYIDPASPFPFCVRPICEAGMTLCEGLPLHAALVEKDGYGVVFLGPSGMGKSTQAKLWEKYLDADFVIGDRPGFHRIDGVWYGYGMPWDGKDNIRRQKSVPVKAVVSLEQAKENRILRLKQTEAMQVLLKQTMMPMWDKNAMNELFKLMGSMSQEIPFYHLKNKADEECVELTYKEIFG
ncbi:MAG: hypothetical protein MJ113_01025 [Lachnospiraceae bacterium]|nr:hypothetical protein [Lachnospiraceae bacterium]